MACPPRIGPRSDLLGTLRAGHSDTSIKVGATGNDVEMPSGRGPNLGGQGWDDIPTREFRDVT